MSELLMNHLAGRAGGGEELGGLLALDFYNCRAAVRASTAVLGCLGPAA